METGTNPVAARLASNPSTVSRAPRWSAARLNRPVSAALPVASPPSLTWTIPLTFALWPALPALSVVLISVTLAPVPAPEGQNTHVLVLALPGVPMAQFSSTRTLPEAAPTLSDMAEAVLAPTSIP